MSEIYGRGEYCKPSPTYSSKSLPFGVKEHIEVKPEIKEIQKMLRTAKIEQKVD